MAAESPSASELVSPDPELDHFSRLGLEPRWGLDRGALESSYREQSKVVHPDRFVNADSRQKRLAMEHSSLINEAYATLRDPVRRAEYLVKLGGIDLDSTDPERGAPHPSQAFLIEMIEHRERLEEASGKPDQLDALRDEIEGGADDALDQAVDALDEGELRPAAEHLITHRYLRRFLEEIERAAESS